MSDWEDGDRAAGPKADRKGTEGEGPNHHHQHQVGLEGGWSRISTRKRGRTAGSSYFHISIFPYVSQINVNRENRQFLEECRLSTPYLAGPSYVIGFIRVQCHCFYHGINFYASEHRLIMDTTSLMRTLAGPTIRCHAACRPTMQELVDQKAFEFHVKSPLGDTTCRSWSCLLYLQLNNQVFWAPYVSLDIVPW